jgi:hypothetical protein
MFHVSFVSHQFPFISFTTHFRFTVVVVMVVGVININFNTLCYDAANSASGGGTLSLTLAFNLISICVRMSYVVVWIFLKLRMIMARPNDIIGPGETISRPVSPMHHPVAFIKSNSSSSNSSSSKASPSSPSSFQIEGGNPLHK